MLVGVAGEDSIEVRGDLGSQEEDASHSKEAVTGEEDPLVKEGGEEPDHIPKSFAEFAITQGARSLYISLTPSLSALSSPQQTRQTSGLSLVLGKWARTGKRNQGSQGKKCFKPRVGTWKMTCLVMLKE